MTSIRAPHPSQAGARPIADYAAGPGGWFDRLGSKEPRRFVTGGTGGGGGAGDLATHKAVYKDLAAALAEGRPPLVTGREAMMSLELTNAMTLSSVKGTPVTLPLDAAAYDRVLDDLLAHGRR